LAIFCIAKGVVLIAKPETAPPRKDLRQFGTPTNLFRKNDNNWKHIELT
jgi:hypothetical protein